MRALKPYSTWLEHEEWEAERFNREQAGMMPHFIFNIVLLLCLFWASLH